MRTILKLLHLLGFAAFLGSVFGHIFVGRFPAAPGQLGLLMELKHASTGVLTLPALGLTVASGLALAWTGPGFATAWVRAKLALALLVIANAALFLGPLGAEIARQAVLGQGIAELAQRESLLGAANLAMVLAIVVIAVRRARP